MLQYFVYDAPPRGTFTINVSVQKEGLATIATKTIAVLDVNAVVAEGTQICVGESATLSAALTGTPPFRVAWSDGLVQDGINSFTTARTVAPFESRPYSLTTFSDAHCSGNRSGTAFVDVISTGTIAEQPKSQNIGSGQTATLMVDANGIGLRYDWYEALAGGTSLLVASGPSPLFTTASLTKTTTYWVEVVNACGTTRSTDAVINIAGRRRSVRH